MILIVSQLKGLLLVTLLLITLGCDSAVRRRPISIAYLADGEIGHIRRKPTSSEHAGPPEARIASEDVLRNHPDICDVRIAHEYNEKFNGSADIDATVDFLIRKAAHVEGDAQLSYQFKSGQIEKWTLFPDRLARRMPAPIAPDIARYLVSPDYEFATIQYRIHNLVVTVQNRGTSVVTLRNGNEVINLAAGDRQLIELSEASQVKYNQLPTSSPARQDLQIVSDKLTTDDAFTKNVEVWSKNLPETLKLMDGLAETHAWVTRLRRFIGLADNDTVLFINFGVQQPRRVQWQPDGEISVYKGHNPDGNRDHLGWLKPR